MTTIETALGWGIIIFAGYIMAVHTDVSAKMKGGLSTATVTVKSVGSKQRVLDLGGFVGGIVLGPKIIAWVMAGLGGLLGGVALDGAGFTDLQIFIAGMVAIVAGVLVSRRR